MESSIFNEWRWVSLSPFPWWALGLLGLALIAGFYWSAFSLKKQDGWRRGVLLGLRAASVLVLFLLLMEPGKRWMQVTKVKNRVIVLLDSSLSMGFSLAPGKQTRYQAAQQIIKSSESFWKELSTRFQVDFFIFDKNLQAINRNKIVETAPRGVMTDIANTFRQISSDSDSSRQKLAGIILFSDGADNKEWSKGLSAPDKEKLKEMNVPISVIALGEGRFKDLSVERIEGDDFAFVRNSMEIVATFRVVGFTKGSFPVALKREGQVVATRNLQVQKDGNIKVVFSFTPDRTGRFVYTVEAPVFENELIATNNSRSFTIHVIRDRVRVLMVVGRPSWDVRFLRGILKQDPNIDLISFFILRTANDDARVQSDGELSLIPFPVRDIFHDQLKTFDVVILQDFGWSNPTYPQMSQYVRGMKKYIEDGGALVMVGGKNSFGEGQYERTELQEALPVEPVGIPPGEESFIARLAKEGRRHPVMSMGLGEEESVRAWAQIPKMYGSHVVSAKPGAIVLLEHPFLTQGGKNVPVMAVGEYGRGRVLAIMTDSFWRLGFDSVALDSGFRLYDRFWNNAIRWLVRDPELTLVKVSVEKSILEPGEPVVARVSVHNPDYRPAPKVAIELDWVRSDGNQVVKQQTATANLEGIAQFQWTPLEPGPYRLVARAKKERRIIGLGENAFAVEAAGAELGNPWLQLDLLREIALATGGKLSDAKDISSIPLNDKETMQVGRIHDVPIWDHYAWLGVLAVALVLEWILRRRWGYA